MIHPNGATFKDEHHQQKEISIWSNFHFIRNVNGGEVDVLSGLLQLFDSFQLDIDPDKRVRVYQIQEFSLLSPCSI